MEVIEEEEEDSYGEDAICMQSRDDTKPEDEEERAKMIVIMKIKKTERILYHSFQRFCDQPSCLGFEGFKSQTHCWDIEVGDSADWIVVMRLR